ncbi:MAG: pentapeptide repeat-containing protein, partial [Verrucomicrobiales bacterium]|nr:pentapeptide repeat-containing protein [Verrucomicrobiales bacterium]
NPEVLPEGWKVVNGHLLGPTAVIEGADLSGADLEGLDLSDAKMKGVQSGDVEGEPLALPESWIIINGYLIGPGADLGGIDLKDMDLSGADLTGISSGSVRGEPLSLPENWSIVKGYLVGPTADLKEANFSEVDFSEADLSGTNLEEVNFTKTNLTNAVLTGSTGLDSVEFKDAILDGIKLPEGYEYINGYVAGGERIVPWSVAETKISVLEERIEELLNGADPDQTQGGRVSSVMIEADPLTGELTLTLRLEESDDLINWDPVGDVFTRKILLPEDKRFYRFSIEK